MALKPEQEVAIHYLSQVGHGGLTQEEIAKECGVSRMTLYNWRTKDVEFQKALKRAIVANTLSDLPAVAKSMVDASVEDRNAAAAKLIFQMHEMLSDSLKIEEKKEGVLENAADLKNKLKGLLK
jgi:AcrR family transcriptional regulator